VLPYLNKRGLISKSTNKTLVRVAQIEPSIAMESTYVLPIENNFIYHSSVVVQDALEKLRSQLSSLDNLNVLDTETKFPIH